MSPRLAAIVWPSVFLIAMFAIWEATCRIFAIPPSFLPAPLQVFAAIVQYWVPTRSPDARRTHSRSGRYNSI